jgi:hypothetical protein
MEKRITLLLVLCGLAGGVGRLYCTAVYVTILAMPYHYLPLYQR